MQVVTTTESPPREGGFWEKHTDLEARHWWQEWSPAFGRGYKMLQGPEALWYILIVQQQERRLSTFAFAFQFLLTQLAVGTGIQIQSTSAHGIQRMDFIQITRPERERDSSTHIYIYIYELYIMERDISRPYLLFSWSLRALFLFSSNQLTILLNNVQPNLIWQRFLHWKQQFLRVNWWSAGNPYYTHIWAMAIWYQADKHSAPELMGQKLAWNQPLSRI